MKHVEEVQVKVVALRMGQHGGYLHKAGQTFLFVGKLFNGNFPSWVEPVKEFESEYSKLSVAEKAKYEVTKINGKPVKEESLDLDKIKEEMRAEILEEAKDEVRKELAEEFSGGQSLDSEPVSIV